MGMASQETFVTKEPEQVAQEPARVKGPEELLFEKLIQPRLLEMHELCQQHDIPMLASFAFDPNDAGCKCCTTAYLPKKASPQMHMAADVLLAENPMQAMSSVLRHLAGPFEATMHIEPADDEVGATPPSAVTPGTETPA